MKLNPAEYVIEIFGGVRATATALGLAPSSVCEWRTKKYVPLKVCIKLLKMKKLNLNANDLMFGKEITKVK